MSQGTRQRESTNKSAHGSGHNKRVVNWEAVEKSKREKNALKRRKVRARKRRSAYVDFIHNAFHGKGEFK